MPEQHTTSLSKSWTIRMLIISAAAFGLGLWGLYDATVAYPARGVRSAERFELDYLQLADQSGLLARAGVENPAQRHENLSDLAASQQLRAESQEAAQLRWLSSLKIIKRLDAEWTDIPREGVTTARARLDELQNKLNTKSSPKPLSKHDITMQWVIFGVGCGIGALVVAHFVRIGSRKYRWDPDEQRLTLPGGDSFVPSDVKEFDRRRWEKFLMFVKIKPDHESLGGREIRFDLLHHAPLEEWVVAMEKTAFPPNDDEPTADPEPETRETVSP